MAGVSDPVGQWPDRRPPAPGEPIRILFGRPRFTADHAWEDIPLAWDGKAEALADRVVIEHVGDNELDARLTDDAAPVHVVVPIMSPVTGAVIERGAFGLVQQFGAGVDSIDLAAAARCGVYVANMPGLNAVPVAEHAMALLLALARRFPEARDGFRADNWGEPGGLSLAGTTAAVIGLGAIGTQIARRLAAFDVTVIGVRRHADPSAPPPVPGIQVASTDRLHEILPMADSVLIAASYTLGQPPLVDAAAIDAMRPGTLVVNVARGGLLDEQAALAALRAGRIGGLGLDVFQEEPYPADGPLLAHSRVIATAHSAALTSGFFHDAARRLGDALYRWVSGRPIENLVLPVGAHD